ncbi:hypothetical protein [Thermomonospora amylolytica]|uniref:hypothetical protein n=1 Tax=Thermomonospora amylolytica TaxID=1411117 RepID=UPI001300AF17|nr:hypothetical protein [Thermomonospora amylolytica]
MRVALALDASSRGDVSAVPWPPVPEGRRQALIDYLEQGAVVVGSRGFEPDMLDPARPPRVPTGYRTDGVWVWPDAVPYYLRTHDVPPQPDLVAHIQTRGFRIPQATEDSRGIAAETVAAATGTRIR